MLSHLYVLGYRVWVHIPKEKRKKLDEKSYQRIHVGYESTNQYQVYDCQSGRVFITRDVHFDKANCYDRKDLKPKDFADDEWHKKDDKLLPDATDILDASKRICQFDTIQKIYEAYLYSIESCASSPFLDISDLVRDEKYHDEDEMTPKN